MIPSPLQFPLTKAPSSEEVYSIAFMKMSELWMSNTITCSIRKKHVTHSMFLTFLIPISYVPCSIVISEPTSFHYTCLNYKLSLPIISSNMHKLKLFKPSIINSKNSTDKAEERLRFPSNHGHYFLTSLFCHSVLLNYIARRLSSWWLSKRNGKRSSPGKLNSIK